MAYHIQAGNRRSSEGTRADSQSRVMYCPVVLIQMHEQNRTLHNQSKRESISAWYTRNNETLSAPHKVFDSTFKMLRDRSHFFRK
ncbi:hypothetical protein TNCV_3532931 [Trichonephila clavipes]|nr:hypothetical protein TNCV_3532931 [Trichonephila clavipes]